MTAHELLSQLRAKGVELKTSGGDRLVIDAPKGTVTEDLRAALSANKAELLQILNMEANKAVAPPAVEAAPAFPETPPIIVLPVPEAAEEVSQHASAFAPETSAVA